MARRAVFLDRDHTVIDDPGYLSDPDAVKLLPGVERAIRSLTQAGYKIVVVTTQRTNRRRYRFRVTGKANPEACGGVGESCGPFGVTFGLYDECPGAGGQLIPGTGSSAGLLCCT